LVEENGLEPGDIWNMDETGFRVGCISQSSLVVTRKEVKKAYLASPKDRTLITSIECVSRDRGLIDPVIILPQKCFIAWFYPKTLPDSYLVAHSNSGYNNAKLGL